MNGAHLMSDVSPELTPEEMPDPAEPLKPELVETAGGLIRKAREASGLHIAALAVTLKVSVKKLEALEADRFELLPDAVFVRGLASSVCRTLKTDPAPILALLPHTSTPHLMPDESGINAPFKAPGDLQGQSVWSQLSRPVVLASLALLCGALVLVFFPTIERTDVVSQVNPPALVAAADAPAAASISTASPPESVGTEKNGNPLTVATQSTAPAESATTPKSVAPIAESVNSALPSVPTSSSAAASGILVFSTRSESWVEVTDAKGVVQLRTIILPGTPAKASGALPLSVVIGRADATEVLLRGRPYAITGVSKDNVARFEVK